MNIAEMGFDLSGYEPASREMFRGNPDCPQMVLSAGGIRFNRQTYDYFEGTGYVYFLLGKDKRRIVIQEAEKVDRRRKEDRDRPAPFVWKEMAGCACQAAAEHLMQVAGLNGEMKYRVFGEEKPSNGKRTLLFDLDKCVAYVKTPAAAQAENEEGR